MRLVGDDVLANDYAAKYLDLKNGKSEGFKVGHQDALDMDGKG